MLIETDGIVSKVWADMSWGWRWGEGTGREIGHGAPWNISKSQGNHKKAQHPVGHCNIGVKVCRISQLIGTRFLVMGSPLQSWLFNSCDIKQALCRISVEEWNWWWWQPDLEGCVELGHVPLVRGEDYFRIKHKHPFFLSKPHALLSCVTAKMSGHLFKPDLIVDYATWALGFSTAPWWW